MTDKEIPVRSLTFIDGEKRLLSLVVGKIASPEYIMTGAHVLFELSAAQVALLSQETAKATAESLKRTSGHFWPSP